MPHSRQNRYVVGAQPRPPNAVLDADVDPAHPSRFFVAKLKDRRLFAVEYKSGDRIGAGQEEEKRLVGELCAKRSGGRGIYLMACMGTGNLRDQLLAPIAGK